MWLAGGQSLKPLPLPPQDRFVLHSSPGDGKQMVLDGEGEVTKEAGDLLPTNLLVGGGGRCDGVSELAGDAAGRILPKDERIKLLSLSCPWGSVLHDRCDTAGLFLLTATGGDSEGRSRTVGRWGEEEC